MTTTVVLILVATAASLTFTVRYAFFSKWWLNIVGKMQMNKSFALSLSLGLTTLNVLTNADYPGRDFIRFVVFTYLAASLWIQVFVLIWIQNKSRSEFTSLEEVK